MRVEPAQRPGYRNQRATERTISALRAGGRLEPVDDGSLALARHLACALDSVDAVQYPAQTASLTRVHLTVLRSLRGLVVTTHDEPGIDGLLAFLSAPAGDDQLP